MEVENLNIGQLIDHNSITRLNKEYKNRFLQKIKDTFIDNEQQLFASSFYLYLNYDAKKDFVIEFDSLWKWLGFTRKDNAKRMLEKHFVKDIDYKIFFRQLMEQDLDHGESNQKHKNLGVCNQKAAPQVGGAAVSNCEKDKNLGGSGLNKETIMLTINAFKKYCLKSDTKKADSVHNYYIKLEELLQETINDESNELQKQLTNTVLQLEQEKKEKEEIIIQKNKELEIKTHIINIQGEDNFLLNQKIEKVNRNHQSILRRKELYRLRQGGCVYLINMRPEDKDKLIKVGCTKDITERVTGYRTSNPFCEVIFLLYTDDYDFLENMVIKSYEKNLLLTNREFIQNIDNQKVIDKIKQFADILNLEYQIEMDTELEKFNLYTEKGIEQVVVVNEEPVVENIEQLPVELTKRCGGITHETEESRFLPFNKFFRNKSNQEDGYSRLCKDCYLTGVYGDKRKIKKTVTIPEYDKITHKWCNRCESVKNRTEFYNTKNTKDGIYPNCKTCKADQKKISRNKKKVDVI